MKKIAAFIVRDFKIALSYRFDFILRMWGVFFQVIIFFYISKIIDSSSEEYFSFVLVGMAFYRYVWYGVIGFSKAVSEQQMAGTLEAMLVTGTGLNTIILSSSLWGFIYTSLEVVIYFIFGVFIFDMTLAVESLFSVLIILLLTIITSCSMGVIASSFIIVFKKGDPVGFLATSFSMLFGGVFFPVKVMPDWLQPVSCFLPIFHSLNALRHAILEGFSFGELFPDMAVLLAFSFTLTPLSLLIFHMAVKRAKMDGTLTQF